ncbi:MAG TPA: TIGR04290 family methyltransferase [Bryobacteraceae bacterium]|nr:TIGR04290 family methyltransferase [Bryobacteraceae bacterium]
MSVSDTAAVRQRIHELGPWFHNMNIAGVQTAPDHFLGDYPNIKWRGFAHAIPGDLTGRTVLDIGCNAGFYALEMKRRGAARVVGIDYDERYLEQARFAAEIAGADIEFRKMTVYHVDTLKERFDVVLFLGVLYHLRYPLLALDLLHDHVCRDLLVFQSMMRGSMEMPELKRNYHFRDTEVFEKDGYPLMYFVEHEYANDWTNWWIPNRACAAAMLRSAGFEIADDPEQEVFICRWKPERNTE